MENHTLTEGRVMSTNLEGRRVRLIATTDPYTHLTPGEEGTVICVDDVGTVHVAWDNGSTLGLIPSIDQWEYLP